MKKVLTLMIFGMLFFVSCKDEKADKKGHKVEMVTCAGDGTEQLVENELAQLIKKVITWKGSGNGIDLAPPKVIENDTVFKSFDNEKVSENLVTLRKTGFFTKGFIDNYENIIKTLDRKLKNGDFGVWYGGELPPFLFDSDVDPWCNCQDDPGDWNDVKVGIKELHDTSGKFFYYFGEEQPGADDYRYEFNAMKENGVWKIDWMDGFDYEASTKSDGL